jgi:catechol 2,3-dioxygenase-like lactoylglutathione lyase family enzyme
MPITDASVHATLAVADLEKAKAWYAEKLGWEPLAIVEVPDTAIYKVGDSYFTLYPTQFAGTAKNTVMNWNVADVRVEVERLKRRGVTFEEYDFGEYKTVDGIMSDPAGGSTAWFKDLDGSIVALLQAPPGQGSNHALSVMLAASDLARAKAWYAEKLGFEPVEEFGDIVIDYRSDDTSFNVYRTEFAGTAQNTVAIWRMKNIRDEVARLRARGVVFEEYDFGEDGKTVDGIMSDEDGDANAWFKDSEGNILALAEDRVGLPE